MAINLETGIELTFIWLYLQKINKINIFFTGTLLGHASTKHNMKLMDFYEKFYKEEMEAAERQLYVTNSEPEVASESEHIEEEESSNGIIDEESSIITGGRYMAMDDLGKRYVLT